MNSRNRCLQLMLACVFGLCLIPVAGCRTKIADLKTPSGTYSAYREAREKGDFQAIFDLLVTQVRDQISVTNRNFLEASRLIQTGFPSAMRQQALADLGPAEVREAQAPADYYAALCRLGSSGMEVSLSVAERWSAEVKTIREDPPGSGKYLVSPMSGAVVELFREEDGRVHMVPARRDLSLIGREYTRSFERLEAVRDALKTMGNGNGGARGPTVRSP